MHVLQRCGNGPHVHLNASRPVFNIPDFLFIGQEEEVKSEIGCGNIFDITKFMYHHRALTLHPSLTIKCSCLQKTNLDSTKIKVLIGNGMILKL